MSLREGGPVREIAAQLVLDARRVERSHDQTVEHGQFRTALFFLGHDKPQIGSHTTSEVLSKNALGAPLVMYIHLPLFGNSAGGLSTIQIFRLHCLAAETISYLHDFWRTVILEDH